MRGQNDLQVQLSIGVPQRKNLSGYPLEKAILAAIEGQVGSPSPLRFLIWGTDLDPPFLSDPFLKISTPLPGCLEKCFPAPYFLTSY